VEGSWTVTRAAMDAVTGAVPAGPRDRAIDGPKVDCRSARGSATIAGTDPSAPTLETRP